MEQVVIHYIDEENALMSKRIFHSDQDWLQLIQECRTSGLSDKAWCETNNIAPSTFYNAIARLRRKSFDIPAPAVSKSPYIMDLTSKQEVVQIDICPDTAVTVPNEKTGAHLDNSHTIELQANDFRLKISNDADPILLEQVLRMVRTSVC